MIEPYFGPREWGHPKYSQAEWDAIEASADPFDDPEFLPEEVAAEAEEFCLDPDDPATRAALRDILMDDPDLFGDWDRYQ